MPEAAGNINIVLSVNKANYTAAMAEAQRQLDVFAGKTKTAGTATVSSMQAGSAAAKELSGHWENNTRGAVKFLTTIPGVGSALKAAFPLIGGVAFAGMLVGLGTQVVDFVKKANEMPKALAEGFRAMNLAQTSSNDALRITNDRLDDQIAKLEHRPRNVIKDELDEARKKADDLAESLGKDQKAFADLMKANSNGIGEQLIGKASTADVQGRINSYWTEMARLANLKVIALSNGDHAGADTLQQHMDAFTAKEKTRLAADVATRSGNVTIPNSGGQGAAYAQVYGDQSLNLTAEQASLARIAGNEDTASLASGNVKKTGQLKTIQDAKEAAAAQKTAATEALAAKKKEIEEQFVQIKLAYAGDPEGLLQATSTFWKLWSDEVINGSAVVSDGIHSWATGNYANAYNELLDHQQAAAKKAEEERQREIAAVNRFAEEMATAQQRLAEAKGQFANASAKNLQEMTGLQLQHDLATGTISPHDAAIQKQKNDAKYYADLITVAEKRLEDISSQQALAAIKYQGVQKNADLTPEQKAQESNKLILENIELQKQFVEANKQRAILGGGSQVFEQDDKLDGAGGYHGVFDTSGKVVLNTNGEADRSALQDKWAVENTTALGGAKTALEEFVAASRDAAKQMHDLVANTLNGLNSQIITAMMSKRTDFKGVGAGMFKDVANIGLSKAEGSLMSGLGGILGIKPKEQMGTRQNPMFVRVVEDIGSAAGKVFGSASGQVGKVGGFVGSMLKSFLPGFASGGYMDGPSLVGESGPEIFNPSGSGHIIPNHKLTGGGGGDIHFHPGAIDARGATDPAQVDAAVQRGIRAAAPRLTAASVHANREAKLRRPARAA